MKLNNIIKIFGMLGIPFLVASCQDDHFDINEDVSGRGTLWENIQSTDNLSEFADLLNRVYYSKAEGNATSQTYADLFSHDQTFTVWAPQNGSFDYDSWNALLEDGTSASAYKVENQLIRNCMARYSHMLGGSDSTQISLFNDKSAWLDNGDAAIQGVSIQTSNIGASNGVLHVTDGAIPYMPNLYEYINQTEGVDSLRNFLASYEEVEFDEDLSTQGPTVDGNITWVDSVSHVSNRYLNYYMNARLNDEDSTYAVVIPSNTAWQKAYTQIRPYFNYMSEYVQSVNASSSLSTDSTVSQTTTFTDEELDSITSLGVHDVIAGTLAYSMTQQFGHNVSEIATPGACDSIISTAGYVIHDPYSAEIFDGVSPTELSNGYAFVVDNYNFRPEDIWLVKNEREAEYFYEFYDYCTPSTKKLSYTYTYLSDSTDETSLRDTTITETVLQLSPERSTSNSSITIQLPRTYSCKYDIYAVMAYNVEAARPYQFRAYVNYHNNRRTTTRQQLSPIEGVNGTGHNFRTKAPHVDENGVFQFNDSVLLASDFEFPVCYVGLENAYPTLEISSNITSSMRTTYTNELLIDKIVLVPKVRDEQ